MALYNGYSFNSNGESKSTIHWPCVKAYSKCRARLTTSLEGKLTRVTADHNHTPPRFIVSQYVISRRGKRLLKLDGYSFYSHRTSGLRVRWMCTLHRSRRCRAAVYTYGEEIIKKSNHHNHDKSNSYA
ncbi:FLYWCH zinc finger domain-containing protein [Phthorimaea operculella]|nr:FLYWCH zinc finger domain-containing protein [Phthorimaea operculella]